MTAEFNDHLIHSLQRYITEILANGAFFGFFDFDAPAVLKGYCFTDNKWCPKGTVLVLLIFGMPAVGISGVQIPTTG